ncbi:MAG: DUF2442 domain-containing protein [Bacteroidetes bacterium]|nr:DUF2442 domain-containing protein [Bacteroidota bacterium]
MIRATPGDPAERFPRLLNANSEQRSKWELIGDGIGAHWPDIDEDVEIESPLAT